MDTIIFISILTFTFLNSNQDDKYSRMNLSGILGHILRRNCLLQRVIEGKIQGGIEVTGR